MTVINVMRFNKESGGMVADSQGSTQMRKYDLFVKSMLLGNKFIMGGTGSSSVLDEAGKGLAGGLYDPKKNTYENAQVLSMILNESYRGYIDDLMKAKFGFCSKEFIAGRLADGTPIGQHLIQPAGEVYSGGDQSWQQKRANEFVVIGRDEDDCRIYYVPMIGRPTMSSLPFATAGSGMDEADNVLHDFMRSIPREKRQEIEFVPGMATLIRATNRASDLNPGVGGVPTISYLKGELSRVLPEQDSILATEIVRVADKGLVTEPEALQSLENLLGESANFKDIEDKIFWGKNSSKEIMRFLRGYRV